MFIFILAHFPLSDPWEVISFSECRFVFEQIGWFVMSANTIAEYVAQTLPGSC